MSKYLDNDGLLYFWSKIKSYVTTAIRGKADTSSLRTVATSGSYNDLSNKPTIPTVNNATLTIQKNGTSAGTFTANASANKTVNITVPTTVAELTDAGNYALKSEVGGAYVYKGSKATTANLPTTGNKTGDVWNVETDGMNYAWTGSRWDALGGTFAITSITNAEIDTICAS